MTGGADPELASDIARAERALQDALNELRVRVSQGRRDDASRELVRRCKDLARLLREACGRLPNGDDEDATRAAAEYLAAHVVILEREVEQVPLH